MASKTAAQRAAARKQRDKWRSKRWFNIRAPRSPWQYRQIGETIAETEEQLVGRVFEITQQEFDGDFSKMHVKLRFRITDTIGSEAVTEFVGHTHLQDHVRRQVRRHRGKIDDVVDVITTDGYLVRIKPLLISEHRIQSSLKSSIRLKTRDTLLQQAAKTSFAEMQQQLLDGTLENEIRTAIKQLYPIRTILIRKSELLQGGVIGEAGPTLDDIRAEEAREQAAVDARKKAALDAAMAEEEADESEDDEDVTPLMAAQAMESIREVPEERTEETLEAEKDGAVGGDEEAEEAPAPAAEAEPEPAPAAEAPAPAPAADATELFLTIPGVGPATASKLAEAGHGSLDDLRDAGVDGLGGIKGVSAALAQKIVDHLA